MRKTINPSSAIRLALIAIAFFSADGKSDEMKVRFSDKTVVSLVVVVVAVVVVAVRFDVVVVVVVVPAKISKLISFPSQLHKIVTILVAGAVA